MDEVNHDVKPKRARVLRAADIIPPFGKIVPQTGDGEIEAEPPRAVPPEADDNRSDVEHGLAGEVEPIGPGAGQTPTADLVIPTYDLAENILAEQRRTAARRRRRPGRVDDRSVTPVREGCERLAMPAPMSQDLLELQRIVAEIVARDIERLCRKPSAPVYARL
ncbi:MAG: hypothetical protein A2Y77_10865 [Planctomycetes bacterium RBG_13_62_9]|nr:MAG: hypothetical protein A2Y77_10865 [Planctomycetes bacterium RBG_13_62_9]